MSDRVEMKHRNQNGTASVLPEHVEAWEAAGWKQVTPARGAASAKKRVSKDAKTVEGKDND